MIKRSNYERDGKPRKETKNSPQSGDDIRAHFGGRAIGQCLGGLPPGRHQSGSILPVAGSLQEGCNPGPQGQEVGPTSCGGPRESGTEARDREAEERSLRVIDRAFASEKKRQLGLQGDLRGRHLNHEIRRELLFIIDIARDCDQSLASICRALELNTRAVNRWQSGDTHKVQHGGGGGQNKIRPDEEEIVLKHARKTPHASCRRIAYDLERKNLVFIGKTKVSEILKANNLNRPKLNYGENKTVVAPKDYLLHEPWKANLLWGMDWTWVRVGDSFMFLQVIVDWYSRLIVAWGLFHRISQQEVIATVTDAVAKQGIDLLPPGALKPRIVADHGSANTGELTRTNIEVQGLDLWLSGIGRPTGNARTERTIGTLKEEEIKLQPFYKNEREARNRIYQKIWDYNNRRPNSGNGGFAPIKVHRHGRKLLADQRKIHRQETQKKRKEYWNQAKPTDADLT